MARIIVTMLLMREYLFSSLGLGWFYQTGSKEHGRRDAMPVLDLAFQRTHSFLWLSLIFWFLESRGHIMKLPLWCASMARERGLSHFYLWVLSVSPDTQMIEAVYALLAVSGLRLSPHEWCQVRLVEKLLDQIRHSWDNKLLLLSFAVEFWSFIT